MWDLPGIEPMSPALAGGFFTTEPPGKPRIFTGLKISPDWVLVKLPCQAPKSVRRTPLRKPSIERETAWLALIQRDGVAAGRQLGFPHTSVGKESSCNAGDSCSILG